MGAPRPIFTSMNPQGPQGRRGSCETGQPGREAAGRLLSWAAKAIELHRAKATQLVARAQDNVLYYLACRPKHWTRICSSNPLGRLDKEINRLTNVVGALPDEASVDRRMGAILRVANDEWRVGRHCFSKKSMRKL